MADSNSEIPESVATLPCFDVTIEIPRGSFLKRGTTGNIDFVSPFPCPFNYGSIRQYIGCEGDFLDAVVLGPRLPIGSKVRVYAFGAIGLSERFMYDDKLICADRPITITERKEVVCFFHFYAFCKGLLNFVRGQKGRSRCTGWGEVSHAMSRAIPIGKGHMHPARQF